MKLFKLIALLLIFLLGGCAKDIVDFKSSVFGKITCAVSGEPIKSATITLTPGGESIITGSQGTFEFKDLVAGQYELQAQKDNYQTNVKQIDVISGNTVSGDMALTLVDKSTKVKLSTNTLDFGTTHNSLTFDIKNIGNAGIVNWTITGVDANWISVTPTQGSTDMGKSSVIKVELDRGKLTEEGNYSTNILLNADGESFNILIKAEYTTGTPGPDPSSGTVISCDSDIEIKLVSCEVLGSNVIVSYTMKNNGPDIAKFNLDGWGSNSYVYDNLGNSYIYSTFKFANKNAVSGEVSLPFPSGVLFNGSITVNNVPSNVTSFSQIAVNCGTYASSWTLDSKIFVFKSVKIREGDNTPEPDPNIGTVTSCDKDIKVEILSCEMSGSSAVLEYIITNNGPDIAKFNLDGWHRRDSYLYDNLGNSYEYPILKLANKKAVSGEVGLPFPNGVILKGSITVENLPTNATSFSSIAVNCETYASSWQFDGTIIIFKNVKISR